MGPAFSTEWLWIAIILRSSEKVARHTLDMFDMWKGELVFENVPIKSLETQPDQ